MNLEDKMKKYPTVKSDNCPKCGNPWFFDKETYIECTTCHEEFEVLRKLPIELNYAELVEQIKKLPMTWVPSILLELIEVGYEKNVFQPGGASRIVQNAEMRLQKTKGVDDEETPRT